MSKLHMESSRQILSALQAACDLADNAGYEEIAQACETAIGHIQALDVYATLVSRLEDLAEWNETAIYSITAEQTTADAQTLHLACDAGTDTPDVIATAASPTDLLARIHEMRLWSDV